MSGGHWLRRRQGKELSAKECMEAGAGVETGVDTTKVASVQGSGVAL